MKLTYLQIKKPNSICYYAIKRNELSNNGIKWGMGLVLVRHKKEVPW